MGVILVVGDDLERDAPSAQQQPKDRSEPGRQRVRIDRDRHRHRGVCLRSRRELLQRCVLEQAQRLDVAEQDFATSGRYNRLFTDKQDGGQRFLERLDALRDGSAGDIQYACGALEALLLDDGRKSFKLLSVQHVSIARVEFLCRPLKVAKCPRNRMPER